MAKATGRVVVVGLLCSFEACHSSLSGLQQPGAGGGVGGVAEPDLAPACAPETIFTGDPIVVADSTWTWVPFPEARCRDGTTTGIGVRLRAGATRVLFYFEGGAACFHDASCNLNSLFSHFDQSSFNFWSGNSGNSSVFDSSRVENPFRDWSFVYVPYCTGDVHAGNAEHVDVPGNAPKNQYFVGYKNIGFYLQRLVPTLGKAQHVVVTGVSAGGFGAAFNYDRLATAFCHSRVTLIDDSGPVMSDLYLAPCLQKRWRDLWNLNDTLPADCTTCRNANGGGLVNYIPYVTQKYPNEKLAIVSANQDSIMSTFYGYGLNDCAGLNGNAPGLTGPQFEAGLMATIQQYLTPNPNWAYYVVASTNHTWINPFSLYSTTVHGVPLTTWLDELIDQNSAMRVEP